MKYLLLFAFMVIAPAAMASTDPAIDIPALLTLVLGDKAASIVVVISVVGYLWAQCRQLIPARYLAKLPTWLITGLELLAANKGQAANELDKDPRHVKRVRV